jgi:hypothetical protein
VCGMKWNPPTMEMHKDGLKSVVGYAALRPPYDSAWTTATCFRRHKLRRSDMILAFPRKRESISYEARWSVLNKYHTLDYQ